MSTAIDRRLWALERPHAHGCMLCELARLREASIASTANPPPACTHWPRRTLVEVLRELNSIERNTP